MSRTTSLAFLCVIFLPLAAAASGYQGSFERKFQVTGSVQLQLDTSSWDATIHSGPAGVVTITGKIHVSNRWLMGERTAQIEEIEKNPPVRQQGNTIYLDHLNLHNIYVDYEVTVPAETRVQSRMSSGDLRITGLHGDLDLESTSGDVWLDDITGNIRMHSGSGDVRARGISGNFSAQASSGDIRLQETAKADVDIHTGSGNIEVNGVDGALRMEAGSGDVSAEGNPAGAWYARTGSGNVHLTMPHEAAFNLDATTDSGELNINHAVTITVQGNLDASRHELKGTVGSGGPTVTLHTGSGDIEID